MNKKKNRSKEKNILNLLMNSSSKPPSNTQEVEQQQTSSPSHNNNKVKIKDPKEKKSLSTEEAKFCRLCFESGAQKRPCCNAFYCDHCYVKNQKCPNCNVQTKQEKLTGATYQLKIFSEHEECRVCLDPGLLRRCCGNYYCDDCYYKAPTCRSCGTIVASIREEKKKLNAFLVDRAYAMSVCLGWMLTVFLVISTLCFFAIVAAAELEAPVGINAYTCYGFFRKCEVAVCLDMNTTVAMGVSPLPPINTYTPCTLNSIVKLEQSACIYDSNLYHQSQAALGYDVCFDDFIKSPGVFIFQDTFEYWQNVSFASNLMKSAFWEDVENGFPNDYCGFKHGTKSLSFRGEDSRFAETKDLDIQSGGEVDAWMFMPPLSYDITNPYCRTGYIGTVNLDYSINQGANWTTFSVYQPAIYRRSSFFHIVVEIPQAAWTNSTRFRFNQPVFDSINDNWALDDVRILRYLPNDWHTSPAFQANVQKGMNMIQYAQCCADTDWCSKRLSSEERAKCSDTFGWYDNRSYLFRLSEIIVCVVLLVNIVKFIYVSLNTYFLYHQFPFHDEFIFFINTSYLSNLLQKLPIEYRIHVTMLLNSWNNPGAVAAGNNNHYALNENIMQIHQSARLQAEHREEMDDIEGEGVMLKSKEEIEEERQAYGRKIMKQKKKLQKRMKKKNFKASTIYIEEDPEYLDKLENNILHVRDDNNNILYSPTKDGGQSPVRASSPSHGEEIKYDPTQMTVIEDILPDNTEKLRRQNLAMLRIPFEFDSNDQFRQYFLIGSLAVFVTMFVLEFGISTSFTIYQPIDIFGKFTQTIFMDASILTIFAGFCDFKEIYYILKNTIPMTTRFFPYITIDLSEDNRSLYIGQMSIPLAQIKEITAYPKQFIQWHFIGVLFGVFPYCLFSLLLREAFLDYSTMRFVTPFLGSIMIIRAILGPLFVIKAVYALYYIFSYHFNTRETIGKAMQKKSSLHISFNVAIGMMLLGSFFCALTSIENLPYAAVAGFFGGAMYGLFTGTAHELSIKPWIYMTTLRGGVQITLRKKQVCPCVYWGAYCTDAHNYEEVLYLFTKDDLKFINLLNGGVMALVNA